MSITKTVRLRLEGLIPRDETSALVYLMDVYGLTGQQVGDAIERSQSQVAIYRAGTTPIPPSIKKRLRALLVEAQNVAMKMDSPTELLEVIIDATDEVLEKYLN